MQQLAQHIATYGGAALLIDYGHAEPACGDSFQAMRGHGFVDPLAEPGLADLTAHVNFPLLAHIAETAGLTPHRLARRGFFGGTGLELRSQQLIQLSPERAADIEAKDIASPRRKKWEACSKYWLSLMPICRHWPVSRRRPHD